MNRAKGPGQRVHFFPTLRKNLSTLSAGPKDPQQAVFWGGVGGGWKGVKKRGFVYPPPAH
jgi:hypothetical protein